MAEPQPNQNQPANNSQPTAAGDGEQYDYAQSFVVYKNHSYSYSPKKDQGILAIQGKNLVFADVEGNNFKELLQNVKFTTTGMHSLLVVLDSGQKWYFEAFNEFIPVNKQLGDLASSFHVSSSAAQKASVSGNLSTAEALKPVEMAAASMLTENKLASFGETAETFHLFGQQAMSQDQQIDAFTSELTKRGIPVTTSKTNPLLRFMLNVGKKPGSTK